MSRDSENRVALALQSDEEGKAATGRELRFVAHVPPPWFDVQFVDDAGIGIPGVRAKALFSDTTTLEFEADDEGYFLAERVPRGEVRIQLADGSPIEPWGDGKAMASAHDDEAYADEQTIEYVVRSGDSLSSIAMRFGTRWPILYRSVGPDGVKNSERLLSGDPNLIFPGETLWVPTRRRVVRIHTENSASSVTRIRVRGGARPRTIEEKRSAQVQHVYVRRLEHLCVDNLVVAAGWDTSNDQPEVKALCEEITAELALFPKKASTNWCLFLIQGATMNYYDRYGSRKSAFELSTGLLGRVGAYAFFEADSKRYLRAIFDPSRGVSALGQEAEFDVADLIVGEDKRQEYLDVYLERTAGEMLFKALPIWYIAPSTADDWANIVWRGGRGALDDCTGRSSLNTVRHERNLCLLRHYNAVYRGKLESYLAMLKEVPVDQGEDALRRLGAPPEPYAFPMPSGWADGQVREIERERAKISSQAAWMEVSSKIFQIQEHRWSTMGARHEEGSLFFRVQFELEPSIAEAINEVLDTYLFGHLSSYRTVKIEWNFDVGADGFKATRPRSRTFNKESWKLAAGRKFSIGANQTVEIDEMGGEKVTASGTFIGYGMSVDTDGGMTVTAPGPGGTTLSSSWDERGAEGNISGAFSLPGLGSISLGLHFTFVRAETLMMYMSRAPGFFERRSCDELVRTYWKDLTFQEKAKLERLGWSGDIWDVKHLLPPGPRTEGSVWPETTHMGFDAMSPEQRIAAIHLGFTGPFRENWLRFWRNLPPVEEAVQ